MTEANDTGRVPSHRGVGMRLAMLLAVALLPLGLIAALQARELTREAHARSEIALLGETRAAAADEFNAIQRADGAASALASSVLALGPGTAACDTALRDLVDRSGMFSYATYFDLDGRVLCSPDGQRVDVTDSPVYREAMADRGTEIGVVRSARFSGTSVLYARHPVYDDGDALTGFATVSIPHSELAPGVHGEGDTEPLFLLTFDDSGEVLSSTLGLDGTAPVLPGDRALSSLAGPRSLAFIEASSAGEPRAYSVVPLLDGRLYALGGWPPDALAPDGAGKVFALAALPLLMWAASLLVASVAAERLVTRHIRRLTGAITAFAGGERTVDALDFSRAPTEIRDAGEAFGRMAEAVLHDEAELEDIVHQKEVLLREVHHRVKNNLQLIASVMNMQAREATNPESVRLLRRLQDRVMSLATVHRELYQTTGQADIRVDELIPDIVRQVVTLGSGPGRRFAVETEFDDIRLTPDQAVPLALLVTEAITNATKYAGGAGEEQPRIAVTLLRDGDGDGTARLRVENSRRDLDPGAERVEPEMGLGARLISAFTQQLGGRGETAEDGSGYTLEVVFPVSPLSNAEERHATAAAQSAGAVV